MAELVNVTGLAGPPGPSAKATAIAAGLIAATASDSDFIAYLAGLAGGGSLAGISATGIKLTPGGARSIADGFSDLAPGLVVARGDYGPPQSVDFPGSAKIGQQPVPGIAVIGSPTVSIGASGGLEVVSAYNDASKRVWLPGLQFAQGRARMWLRRGADAANSTFMVLFDDTGDKSRAIWSNDGVGLTYGIVDRIAGAPVTGSANQFGTVGNGYAGGANQTVIVELETAAMFPGNAWAIRTWVDGGQRPASPQLSGSYPTGAPVYNDGVLSVANFGTVPSRLIRAQMFDGRAGLALQEKAWFGGRWFPTFVAGQAAMATSRAGSEFRIRSTGTTGINIGYVVAEPYDVRPAALDVFVNDVQVTTASAPVLLDGTVGSTGNKLLVGGLDPAAVSRIVARVRGVEVYDEIWNKPAGVVLTGLAPTLSVGQLAAWPDPAPAVLFIGDSITAGLRGRAATDYPKDYGGDLSWPVLAARAAGYRAIVSAFGGTGVVVGIGATGTAPAAPIHAVNYMAGRPIDTVREGPKAIWINLGTNDYSQGTTASAFQTGYTNMLVDLLARFPSARTIFCQYPLNQVFAAQIFAAVGNLSNPRLVTVDSSSWTGITYTDGTHPSLAGHAAIAAIVANVLQTYAPPGP